METCTHIRHGDVLLTRVDILPSGKEIEHKGQYILAFGEVTGHAHRLTEQKKESLKVIQTNGITFLSLTIPAPLTHEEHKQVEIPSGIWKMSIEREYDPYMQNIRTVID